MISMVGACSTLISFLGFRGLNRVLDRNDLPFSVPNKYAGSTRYKWKNVVVSLVHATIVAITGVYW